MRNSWKSASARAVLAVTGKRTVPEAARAFAAKLLSDVASPPTDLDSIAARLGATVHEEHIRGSGELRREGRAYQIIYNPDQSRAQRRFTIAHEIAHLALIQSIQETPLPSREVERLCDLIAVELLFPAFVFRAAFPREWTIEAIFELAKEFQASLTATSHHCAQMAGVTIFEVEGGQIRWVQGPLRKTIALEDAALVSEINAACSGVAGSSDLYLNDGTHVRRWRALFRPLGKTNRALFLITPVAP
jgi:hypothetical protein